MLKFVSRFACPTFVISDSIGRQAFGANAPSAHLPYGLLRNP
nr:MAG TPA: hypothetical protein [Caudoviricetes sp.]